MRFTIRDVLWATVVVALAVGWLVDHQRTAGISAADMERRAWQFETVAAALETHDHIAVSEFDGGVVVKWPNGDAVYYVAPDHLKTNAKRPATDAE